MSCREDGLCSGSGSDGRPRNLPPRGAPRGRARRNREFVEVLRTLWHDDISSHDGESVHFHEVRSYPKPVRDRHIPIVLGGNSDAALDRVVEYGDGWYGFNLSVDEVPGRMAALSARCRQAGRDQGTLEMAVSLRDGSPGDVARLADLGVTELSLWWWFSAYPAQADSWGRCARRPMGCLRPQVWRNVRGPRRGEMGPSAGVMTRRDRATACPVLGDRSRLSGQFGYTPNSLTSTGGCGGPERRSLIGLGRRSGRPGVSSGAVRRWRSPAARPGLPGRSTGRAHRASGRR